MKRGAPLARRTPLRRGKPLAGGSTLRRGGPLPAESVKRKAERPVRAAVRAERLYRAGGRCCMVQLVPEVQCWGPLDVDEIKSRGVNPGGHLDVENTQLACRAHHQWRTEHPELAHERGLRKKSWE